MPPGSATSRNHMGLRRSTPTEWRRIAPGPRASTAAGTLAHNQGDYVAARSFYEESLALSRAIGDEVAAAGTLNDLGWLAWRQGDFPFEPGNVDEFGVEAEFALVDSVDIEQTFRERGDPVSLPVGRGQERSEMVGYRGVVGHELQRPHDRGQR